MAVARHPWELSADFSGPIFIGQDGDLIAAVDASLYYVAALARGLRAQGVSPRSHTPTDLVLAAYRAWGEECVDHLEGDYAFILWDAAAKRVFAARDFQGKRPLYYGDFAGGLVIASTIRAVLAHPRCPDALNLVTLAEDAALLSGSATETSYKAISRLPAGCTLTWSAETGVKVVNQWTPPSFLENRNARDSDSAADELRELLIGAMAERMSKSGPSSIWMSGGWDSPSLYASGKEYLRRVADRRTLTPVSISYPVGDPGREDELIGSILGHWGDSAVWVDSSSVSAFDRFVARTGDRDEATPHPFEVMNRELALGSRATGARIALDGNGGDQLFSVSGVYRADLFRCGRWLELARDWRAGGGGGPRAFLGQAVIPAIPEALRRAVGMPNGNRAGDQHGLGRVIPEWIDAAFVDRHGLVERERAQLPVRGRDGFAAAEARWYLTSSIFPRALGSMGATALEVGIESRSPFLDRRVVEFAARRPRRERRSGAETKILLRRAMRGLLPESVLERRRSRTGLPVGYFLRSFVESFPALFEAYLREPVLADFGIVDPHRLARSWDAFQARGSRRVAGMLYVTLEVEAWLRHRLGAPVSEPPPRDSSTEIIFSR